MGDVVDFPLRVLRPRPTSVVHGWEAALERTVRVSLRFGGMSRPTKLEGTLAGASGFGRWQPTGWLRCRDWGFGPSRGFEEALASAPRRSFERSSLRTVFARGSATFGWWRTVSSRGFGPRSTRRWHQPPRAIRLRCRLGFPRPTTETRHARLRVCVSGTGCVACRPEWTGGFAPQIHRSFSTERDFATSRCGNTLKWHPRTRKAGRLMCSHLERSVPRLENLKAELC